MDIPKIDQDSWGPSGWKFMHYVALKYPKEPSENDKKNYFNFYNNLQFILPCTKCAEHYKENLQLLSLEKSLENNIELFKWTVDIHNLVNTKLNKPNITYEEAIKLYLDNPNKNHDKFIIAGIILLSIIVFYYCKKNNLIPRFK